MADITQTLAERGARYGDFTDHARVSTALRTQVFAEWRRRKLDGTEAIPDVVIEATSMICHKLARIATGDPLYADSWHDIAGYATLVEQRLQPHAEPKPAPPMEVPHERYEPNPD